MGRWQSPTLDTLVVVLFVHFVQRVAWIFGLTGVFVLDVLVVARPWTLVTSVYAHASVAHLFANALALVLLGPLVARRTTRLRFHAFFVLAGIVAGVAQVLVSVVLLSPVGVLGASGALFALLGYLLSGNVVSSWLLNRLAVPPKVQLLVFLLVAVLVTLLTASPGTALVGHATGLLVGLVAGRLRVLDVSNTEPVSQPAAY